MKTTIRLLMIMCLAGVFSACGGAGAGLGAQQTAAAATACAAGCGGGGGGDSTPIPPVKLDIAIANLTDENLKACLNTLLAALAPFDEHTADEVIGIDCSNSGIVSADGLSQFSGIVGLNLSGNPGLASLDLSLNRSLELVDVSGTAILHFDVSQNRALAQLDASNTGMISISGVERINDKTVSVDLSGNDFSATVFDYLQSLKGNEGFSGLVFDALSLGSAIASIGDENFRDCLTAALTDSYANEVLSIVCINEGIESAVGVGRFSALTTLNLSDNPGLSTLDVSDNATLLTLIASGTNMISVFGLENIVSQSAIITMTNNNYDLAGFNYLENLKNNEAYTNLTYDPLSLKAAIASIADANFKSCLNASLTDDFANEVLTIYCEEKDIRSVAGLELFYSLENLNLFGNTNLNVIDISENVSLVSLLLIDTNVGSIDLSDNTSLDFFEISGSRISELDLSANTSLMHLVVEDTNLSVIDLSNNTSLDMLGLTNTGITTLDISNNTALTQLQLGESGLVTLDVSGNPALVVLYADDAGMTSISGLENITNKSAVINLTGNNYDLATYDYLENLKDNEGYVNLEQSGLSTSSAISGVSDANFRSCLTASLNDTYAADVERIRCSNKGITNAAGFDLFSSLTDLDLSNNSGLTSIDLSAHTAIVNLQLSSTGLGSLNVAANTALINFNASNSGMASISGIENILSQLVNIDLRNNAYGTTITNYLKNLRDNQGYSRMLFDEPVPGPVDTGPDFVLFTAHDVVNGRALWRTNGTPEGTFLVKDILPGINDEFWFVYNKLGRYFFGVDDGVRGVELWTSDGTVDGTVIVKDINEGGASGLNRFNNIPELNGKIYFSADNGVDGVALWASDGTESGTYMVKDLIPSGSNNTLYFPWGAAKGEQLFFGVCDETGQLCTELWVTDGTAAGTNLVKLFTVGVSNAVWGLLNDKLYFFADDGVVGAELWVTDGTEAGTSLLKDIREGPEGAGSLLSLLVMNGVLYVLANDGVVGAERWVSDGTEVGTVLLKDINVGGLSSYPLNFFERDGVAYFVADDGVDGRQLWQTDGTRANTQRVAGIVSDGDDFSGLHAFTEINGRLYFRMNDGVSGQEVWITDGVVADSVMLKDIEPGPGDSAPSFFTLVNERVVFTSGNTENGLELWVTDGTEEGTVLLKDINEGVENSFPIFADD